MATFTIPGKPWAKQRPRFSRKSGVAFTPKETVSFENTVRAIAVEHFPEPIEGPVEIEIEACFQMAKSWSKRKRDETWGAPHTNRPDLDNLVKAITDGLNRIAYADDAQIAKVVARKRWTDVEGFTTVKVRPYE